MEDIKKKIENINEICDYNNQEIEWLKTKAQYQLAEFEGRLQRPTDQSLGLLKRSKEIPMSSQPMLGVVFEDQCDDDDDNDQYGHNSDNAYRKKYFKPKDLMKPFLKKPAAENPLVQRACEIRFVNKMYGIQY